MHSAHRDLAARSVLRVPRVVPVLRVLRGAGACAAALLCALAASACQPDAAPALPSFRAVTFNTGTTSSVTHNAGENGGYGDDQAGYSDTYYGNGLAWAAAVDDVHAFFADAGADVVAFQEIFSNLDCADIPAEARAGFVCESWQEGDPSVAQQVLGPDYAVACNLGKPDKCLAVKKSFGHIRGCDGDLCLDGLAGGVVDGCGGGSRIGRGVIDLADGGSLTVVTVHGTSGMAAGDMDCRVKEFRQVFVDLKDGSDKPGADGAHNLILGDFNTDPARLAGADPSADEIDARVNFETPFDFISPIGKDVAPTYAGLVNIDHVISDSLVGACFSSGITPGTPPPSAVSYFDHHPMVCDVGPAGDDVP